MTQIKTELRKRDHRMFLSFQVGQYGSWVTLITAPLSDLSKIQYLIDYKDRDDIRTRRVFNSLLYSFLRNGYNLKEVK